MHALPHPPHSRPWHAETLHCSLCWSARKQALNQPGLLPSMHACAGHRPMPGKGVAHWLGQLSLLCQHTPAQFLWGTMSKVRNCNVVPSWPLYNRGLGPAICHLRQASCGSCRPAQRHAEQPTAESLTRCHSEHATFMQELPGACGTEKGFRHAQTRSQQQQHQQQQQREGQALRQCHRRTWRTPKVCCSDSLIANSARSTTLYAPKDSIKPVSRC